MEALQREGQGLRETLISPVVQEEAKCCPPLSLCFPREALHWGLGPLHGLSKSTTSFSKQCGILLKTGLKYGTEHSGVG